MKNRIELNSVPVSFQNGGHVEVETSQDPKAPILLSLASHNESGMGGPAGMGVPMSRYNTMNLIIALTRALEDTESWGR